MLTNQMIIGFELSAYALQKESAAEQMDEKMNEYVSRGALVDIVQRGLQFLELDALSKKEVRKISTDGPPYSLVRALTLEQDCQDTQNEDVSKVASAPVVGRPSVVCTGAYQQVAAWSPINPGLIGVGSAISCELWELVQSSDDEQVLKSISLIHSKSLSKDKNTVSLGWSHSGHVVAQGCFEGKINVWTADGRLRHSLSWHRAPVVGLSWNSTDTLLLSVDCNNNATVWDAFSGEVRQSVSCAPNLQNISVGNDISWIDSSTFAVTGESAIINVYKVGGTGEAILKFRGHLQGINSLSFDEATQLLSSSSDDHTVRIWHGKNALPLMILAGHTAPVISAQWLKKPADLDPIKRLKLIRSGCLLLSASIDGTLRLWDAISGQALSVITLNDPLLCLGVSPDGKYVAAGGSSGKLTIWSAEKLFLGDSMEDCIKDFEQPVLEYTAEPEAPANTENANGNEKTGQSISVISWSSDSRKLLVVYPDQSVVLKI